MEKLTDRQKYILDVIKKLVFKFIKLFYIFEKYIINLYYILYKQIWKILNRLF